MTENQRRLKRLFKVALKEYDDGAVQALLERDPSAACGVDEILFLALGRKASAATIRAICNACPESAREKNRDDETPLLKACGEGATIDVVRLLHELWPESAREKNFRDETPLHRACRAGATIDIVRLLHELWPQSIEMLNFFSSTPLHNACYSDNVALEVVKFLTEEHPEALAAKNNAGKTPLAKACENTPLFDDLLIFFIEKHPGAIKERDNDERFPLHLACENGASKKVVGLLADKCPEALRSKDEYGDTPLHDACYSPQAEDIFDVVKLLVERYPDAVGERNDDQMTALEIARDEDSPREVIHLLTTLQSLPQSNDEESLRRILRTFHDMEWPGGVALVLNKFPAIANKMDQSLMPRVLSLVGRRCTLDTFYSMFLENPALAKGAVKHSTPVGEPPAKKARK